MIGRRSHFGGSVGYGDMQEAGAVDRDRAAGSDLKSTPDEQTAALALPLFGYHQGPQPRAGCHVRLRRSLRTAVALGTLADHTLLVADDEDGRVYRTSSPSLTTNRQAGRLTLNQYLELAKKLALAGNRHGLSILAAHFRGINGSSYACFSAYAWCVRAMCAGHFFRSRTAEVEAWLRGQFDSLLEPGVELPPAARPEELGLWASKRTEANANAITETSLVALDKALELGADSLTRTLGDIELQRNYGESQGNRLAIDIQSGLQVVVLGSSNSEITEGFVDVLFLDNLDADARHVSGLSTGKESIDPGWLWEVVTDAARHGKSPLCIALWLAGSDVGPSGQSEPSVERSLTRVLGAAYGARHFASERPAQSMKWLRLAKENWRTLPKSERSRVAALVPEIVSSGGKRRLSRQDASLRAAFRTTIEALVARHPVPLIERNSLFPARSTVEIGDVDAVDLVESGAPPTQATAIPRASNAQVRQRVGAVKFGRSQRALRFDLSDYPLLSSEWALVAKDSAHLEAVTSALGWLEGRMGLSLPKTWREGAHEIERQGVSLQLESGEGIFAFRLDHPDTTHPTRWWRMEGTVLAGIGGVGGMVGVRLSARDLVDLPPPPTLVPTIVREWARSPGLVIAGAAAGAPTFVRDEASLSRLVGAVQDLSRDAPLWISGARFELTKPLQGLARLYVIDEVMRPHYAIHVGTLLPNTVHVYGKAGTPCAEVDLGLQHGLERLRQITVDARQRPEVPAFRDIRNAVAEARLRAIALRTDSEAAEIEPPLPAPTAEDIRALVSRDVRDYEDLLPVAEEERNAALLDRDSALHDLEATSNENVELKRRLHSAQMRLGAAGFSDEPSTERMPPPATLADIAAWAVSLRPRVEFPDKTLRYASRVTHNEPALIFACLEQLSDSYWRSRWAKDETARREAREEWEDFLKSHRLRWSGVGVVAARHQSEYRGIVGGATYTMDMHIAGSNAHDPLRCFRIYCFADEPNQRVIVGHLPTHLTNGLT